MFPPDSLVWVAATAPLRIPLSVRRPCGRDSEPTRWRGGVAAEPKRSWRRRGGWAGDTQVESWTSGRRAAQHRGSCNLENGAGNGPLRCAACPLGAFVDSELVVKKSHAGLQRRRPNDRLGQCRMERRDRARMAGATVMASGRSSVSARRKKACAAGTSARPPHLFTKKGGRSPLFRNSVQQRLTGWWACRRCSAPRSRCR